MNTQSHAVINLYILRRVAGEKILKEKGANAVILLGSLLPDLPIFFFFGWYTWIDPKRQDEIWRTLYFDPGWQILFNSFNSIPIFLAILIAAWSFGLTRMLLFSSASLLHFLEDFFIHMEDAHAHFFPLSDYKFISPVSYWDSNGFGYYVSIIEAALVLLVSFFLFRSLKTWWGKGY